MSLNFWLHAHFSIALDRLIGEERLIYYKENDEQQENNSTVKNDNDNKPEYLEADSEHYNTVIPLAYELISEKLIDMIVNDFVRFNFKKQPSINPKFITIDASADFNPSEYLKISLLSHTFNVAYEILQLEEDSQINMILILFALLHDVGKSNDLCAFYGIPMGEHEYRSACYTDILYGETGVEHLKLISECLRLGADDKNKYLFYTERLSLADSLARKKEKELLRA